MTHCIQKEIKPLAKGKVGKTSCMKATNARVVCQEENQVDHFFYSFKLFSNGAWNDY